MMPRPSEVNVDKEGATSSMGGTLTAFTCHAYPDFISSDLIVDYTYVCDVPGTGIPPSSQR